LTNGEECDIISLVPIERLEKPNMRVWRNEPQRGEAKRLRFVTSEAKFQTAIDSA